MDHMSLKDAGVYLDFSKNQNVAGIYICQKDWIIKVFKQWDKWTTEFTW